MAIIIGDIHGSIKKARAFLAYRPDVEHISLGDLVDTRDRLVTFEEELACLDLLLTSNAVLIWGNHDLAYLEHALWSLSYRNQDEFQEFRTRYQSAFEQGRFKAAYSADGWLLTHAGISTALAADLCAAGAPFDTGNATAVSQWLNTEFDRQILKQRPAKYRRYRIYCAGPLFQIDWVRGGNDEYGGMFWYDPRWESTRPPEPRIKQIFAHTHVEGPTKYDTYINIHIDDGPGYWVFDTETDDFAQLRIKEEEQR